MKPSASRSGSAGTEPDVLEGVRDGDELVISDVSEFEGVKSVRLKG